MAPDPKTETPTSGPAPPEFGAPDEPWPIRIERAAELLHCGVRRLKAFARQRGIGRRSGHTIIFSRDDFRRLYDALPVVGAGVKQLADRPPQSEAEVQQRVDQLLAKSRRKGRRGPRRWPERS